MALKAGSIRFNTDSSQMEIWDGNQWTGILATSPELQTGGTRGIYFGGVTPSAINNIDFYNVDTTGNAADFGDMTRSTNISSAGTSSRTRGIAFGGGNTPDNIIEFITISSTGNAQDFGDVASGAQRHANPVASQTRALFCGGYGGSPSPGNCNIIDLVTIAQTGNTVDFGDLSYSMTNGGSCASSTRGVVAGGQNPGFVNNIDHITISTTGSAVDRGGDLTVARRSMGGASNSTRGIFFGGQSGPSNDDNNLTNVIDFITIASNGDATDFGDLTFSINNGKIIAQHGMASATRVVMAGGNTFDSNNVNTIEYVEISTTGNSIDFGTLQHKGSTGVSAFSNGHGGL